MSYISNELFHSLNLSQTNKMSTKLVNLFDIKLNTDKVNKWNG